MERRFRISVPLHSSGNVEVLVKLKAVASGTSPEQPVTDEDIAAVKTRMEAGINQFWNGKFSLLVSDPLCGERAFPIHYKVEWVMSGQDYTMNVSPSNTRENVQSLRLNVSKNTNAWTMAHEYAHCVGIADEYSYRSGEVWTLRYYSPDRTLHEGVIEMPPIKRASDSTANIMSTVGVAITEPRHGWPVALGAQAHLSSEIGRRITCSII